MALLKRKIWTSSLGCRSSNGVAREDLINGSHRQTKGLENGPRKEVVSGLQGPTISRVLTRDAEGFYAIHVVVRKDALHKAIREIREIGGSGVVVSPVNYIFEEEPQELTRMMMSLEE